MDPQGAAPCQQRRFSARVTRGEVQWEREGLRAVRGESETVLCGGSHVSTIDRVSRVRAPTVDSAHPAGGGGPRGGQP